MPLFRSFPKRHLRAVLLLALLVCSGVAQTSDQFTAVLLPDTQFYSESYPFIFYAQTQWIADHLADTNIKFVIGLGDIVNKASVIAQWQNADAAVKTIRARSPIFSPLATKTTKGRSRQGL